MNPYDWQSHHPRIGIPRQAVAEVAETLHDGGSAVVLGGRGMGKSVFLQQLQEALAQAGAVRVVLIPTPPPELTVRACLDKLADVLEVEPGAIDSRKIVDAWFAREDAPPRLVLLFDEFDRYATSRSSGNPPGRGFFNDLEATRRDVQGLGLMAVVQLTDAEIPDWPERYRRQCLEPLGVTIEPQPTAESPIRARFSCRATTADGMTAHVEHYLLRLPRRRR